MVPDILVVLDNNFPRMDFKTEELPGATDFFYVNKSEFRQHKDPELIQGIWQKFRNNNCFIFFITKDIPFVQSSKIKDLPHNGRIQVVVILDDIWKRYFIGTDFHDLGHAPLSKLRG